MVDLGSGRALSSSKPGVDLVADIENRLVELATIFGAAGGATSPFSNQLSAFETAGWIKQRDTANTAWSFFAPLDGGKNVRTISTTPVTLDVEDGLVIVDSTSGAIALTLPTDRPWILGDLIVKKQVAGNSVTIAPPAGGRIDDLAVDATISLATVNEVIRLRCESATQWWRTGS